MLEAFEVTEKGVTKKLSETIINMLPQASSARDMGCSGSKRFKFLVRREIA